MIQDSKHNTDIWNAFRLGDKSAYADIYESHFDALYSYGKKFLPDETQVEDAIQDLFINLWRTREKLSPVDNIKFYLFRSLRRDIRRINEKEKTFEKVDFDSFVLMNDHPGEENTIYNSDDELAQKLTAILKNLPKRQLEAITLRYYENFSIDEIAAIMDVSEKTVRNTLHNSLTLLRKNSNLFYSLIKLALVYFWQ
ncbi:RNA polymerase sigma factor [Dyadobacter sp. NIV53]|uniref:RNA polymerase sigma factor n=1 Tax=Dyadobacter sp. NIV53 TaxID=2861765 RepID=UPI001C88B308|nr:sigma-70 family RNA polymerase sigma factor [Dyadobacter sp. NIV53]